MALDSDSPASFAERRTYNPPPAPASGEKTTTPRRAEDHDHPSELHWLDIGPKVGTAAADINPSDTKDIVGEYARATKADAETAIKAAKAAFAGWARSTPQERYEVLKKVSDEILARREEIGLLLAREEGKTLPEGIGEVVRAGQIFVFFAGEALRVSGDKSLARGLS